ncbi:hypothetical protein PG997_005321 [Apiospora hydei]|uniref:CorA-like transporter domain-containing protein n=1 Tax=Apiospora hydei TaxID=1337664 RepID=A0ABR1X4L0_9PEZI
MERSKINNKSQLDRHYTQHLVNKETDPRVRHLFLTAGHSTAPLNCTLEMFQFLCTYHQVSPGFLDLICSFGRELGGFNVFHHMHILHERFSSTRHPSTAIREIGRSGDELRVGYKLFAMEQQEPEHKNKWVMRQTATYHTLDLAKWKAFWITVKANNVVRERTDEISTNASDSLAAEALSRSLLTHQVMFNWCTEGWAWYIAEVDDTVEKILRPLTAADIPPEEGSLDPHQYIAKTLSFQREKGLDQVSEKTLPRSAGGLSPVQPRNEIARTETQHTTRSGQEREAQID